MFNLELIFELSVVVRKYPPCFKFNASQILQNSTSLKVLGPLKIDVIIMNFRAPAYGNNFVGGDEHNLPE